MVKLRNKEFDDEDIIGYLKIKDIKDKEKSIRMEETSNALVRAISVLSIIGYMFIYGFVFLLAQYGLLSYVELNPESGNPILLLIVFWVAYGMLVLYLVENYRRKD